MHVLARGGLEALRATARDEYGKDVDLLVIAWSRECGCVGAALDVGSVEKLRELARMLDALADGRERVG